MISFSKHLFSREAQLLHNKSLFKSQTLQLLFHKTSSVDALNMNFMRMFSTNNMLVNN